MNRVHRATPSWSPFTAGWISALISRLERSFGTPTRRTSPAWSPFAPAALEHRLHSRPRVLVVDDNPASLGHACELFGRWGIAPIAAADGAEAVALAGVHDFDLILMDLQMPVLDGLAATKQIRAHEHTRPCGRAHVLAYTSHALEADLLRDCGVDGVLEKPCSAEALDECLLRWCSLANSPALETEASAGEHSVR